MEFLSDIYIESMEIKMAKKRIKDAIGKQPSRVEARTKMTARINTQVYLMFKAAYSGEDKSIEERIEELMKRDLDGLMKTDWFREKIAGGYFEVVAARLKSEDEGKSTEDQSDDQGCSLLPAVNNTCWRAEEKAAR
jgi:hypothetical protein